MLEDARDGLLALDEDGAVVEANEAAARILGHDRARLIGKPLAAMVALPDRRVFRGALDRVDTAPTELRLTLGSEAEPRPVVLRLLPRSGPRRIVVTLAEKRDPPPPASPPAPPARRVEHLLLRFPQGVVSLRPDLRVAFANARARRLFGREAVQVGMVFDPRIPELRALARRLVTVPASLGPLTLNARGRDLRVSGLAAGRDEPALLLVEDVTQELQRDRVMRDFVRNAAHQLRTPLTGITAAVETLQSGAKERPEDRDRFLAHIEAHADRLTRVARGLLVLARAQTGEQVRIDLVELEPLLAKIAASALPREGVRVVTDCEGGVAAIAERDLLHEAVAALVDNAVSQTFEGEIRLSAAARNGHVLIGVTDSGRGILPEFRERIFDPFYRVGDDGQGFGLGLAIVAQAVEAMGGGIDVSDAPGGGTTFTVALQAATVKR